MAFTNGITSTVELDNSLLTAVDQTVQLELANSTVFDGLAQIQISLNAKSIELRRYARLAAATTPLSETSDIDSATLSDTKIVLTPKEYGNVVTTTSLVSLQTGGAADLVAGAVIGANAALTQDTLAYNVLKAGGAGVTAPGHMDAAFVEKLYTKLARENVMKIGNSYVLVLHEDQASDLRASAAAGTWVDVMKYAQPGQVLINEIGMYKGFRVIVSNAVTTSGTGAATTYKAIALGANSFGKVVSKPIETRFTGPFDKLGRFVNLGWYGVFDYAVIEPKGVLVATTTAGYNE